MPWQIDLPNGDTVRTDDLLVGKVIDLAKKNEVSWSAVIEFPMIGDGSLMWAMYQQFCAEHGCKVGLMTMTALAGKFTQTLIDEDPDDTPPVVDDPPTVDAPANT